jgi:hypothetical protein
MKRLPMILLLAWCCTGCGPQRVPPAKSSQEIKRNSFSLSLPTGWREDTKDDMYDSESFIIFQGSGTCLFNVIIGKKSAGMSASLFLKNNKQKLLDSSTKEFQKWGQHDGKGIQIDGKQKNTNASYRFRIFSFEKDDSICVVTEAATPQDFKKFAGDYELFRQSLELK